MTYDNVETPTASHQRPPIVTTVGILGIIAGVLPMLEVGAVLASERFRAWFLPLVQAIIPASVAIVIMLLLVTATADLVLGIGVLMRRRWAMLGMILRSILGVGLDCINFQASSHAGALFGLVVNVFVVCAILHPRSRIWFRLAGTTSRTLGRIS
jgi:hypothetical protein